MHRPVSFGSSLQAYALQYKIESLGYNAEIIDYKYPNSLHSKQNYFKRCLVKIFRLLMNMPFGFPNIIEGYRFRNFRLNYLKLSSTYNSASDLVANPPLYDIYCTGSDQVWNSKFTKGDTSFLLSFISKDNKKISYASSFAIDYIVSDYIQLYKTYLSQYEHISVRESSGIKIIRELVARPAQLVCDPTLLLTKEEWQPLIQYSKIKINKPYILVFMLTYSFNPYPEADRIIDKVKHELGHHIVFLSGRKQDYLRKDATVIKSAGPCEFLELVWNASYIITSSFHGVAFSVNFEKDFIAIVKKGHTDSRLISFLKKVNMEDHAVAYDSLDNLSLAHTKSYTELQKFRNDSINYLETILQ